MANNPIQSLMHSCRSRKVNKLLWHETALVVHGSFRPIAIQPSKVSWDLLPVRWRVT